MSKKWPGHEVYPNIYVGDLSCALDVNQLTSRGILFCQTIFVAHCFSGITHVLTATNRMKPMFGDRLHYLVLDFPDAADQNIMDTFGSAHEFIQEAVESGGKILIHCMAGLEFEVLWFVRFFMISCLGQSRSVTVACSYIMKQEGISEVEALARIREHRKDAKPIDAFQAQLSLFHKLRYNVDPDHPEVKSLKRSKSKVPIVRSSPSRKSEIE